MIAGDSYIIFKTTQPFKDKVKVDGRNIFFDPTFRPHENVNCKGTVVQIPLRMKQVPIAGAMIPKGIPSYYEESPYTYKFLTDIVPEVEVGDEIYFHFNTIMKWKDTCVKEIRDDKGVPVEWWFRVRYDAVVAVVRDGKILPIGGYILVRPDYETLDDILHPVYSPVLDPTGQKIPLPKEKWIQVKPTPEYKYLRGYIAIIGTPLIGERVENHVGQLIYYRKHADWVNNIEGTDYFAIRPWHILGGFVDN